MKAILFSIVMALSFSATAEVIPTEGPCKRVKEACEAAGYLPGQHNQGKGLWMNCMNKLKNGKTVPGVNASASDVEACKAKATERKKSTKGVS